MNKNNYITEDFYYSLKETDFINRKEFISSSQCLTNNVENWAFVYQSLQESSEVIIKHVKNKIISNQYRINSAPKHDSSNSPITQLHKHCEVVEMAYKWLRNAVVKMHTQQLLKLQGFQPFLKRTRQLLKALYNIQLLPQCLHAIISLILQVLVNLLNIRGQEVGDNDENEEGVREKKEKERMIEDMNKEKINGSNIKKIEDLVDERPVNNYKHKTNTKMKNDRKDTEIKGNNEDTENKTKQADTKVEEERINEKVKKDMKRKWLKACGFASFTRCMLEIIVSITVCEHQNICTAWLYTYIMTWEGERGGGVGVLKRMLKGGCGEDEGENEDVDIDKEEDEDGDKKKENEDSDKKEDVDGDKKEDVDGDKEEVVDGDKEEVVDGDKEEDVDGDKEEVVDGDKEKEEDGKTNENETKETNSIRLSTDDEYVDNDISENENEDIFNLTNMLLFCCDWKNGYEGDGHEWSLFLIKHFLKTSPILTIIWSKLIPRHKFFLIEIMQDIHAETKTALTSSNERNTTNKCYHETGWTINIGFLCGVLLEGGSEDRKLLTGELHMELLLLLTDITTITTKHPYFQRLFIFSLDCLKRLQTSKDQGEEEAITQRILLQVVVNLLSDCHERREMIRFHAHIPTILNLTSINKHCPVIQQWALLTVSNLCKNNTANQDYIYGLKLERQNDLANQLQDIGIKVKVVDGKMRFEKGNES